MKQKTRLLIPLLAISLLALPVCKGAVVFSDDFSEAPGTPIIGKSPDVGGAWTGVDNGTVVSSQNSLDTTGAARTLFGGFTSALGAGQILTLDYDTLAVSGNNFFNGFAGVSLYSGYTGGTSGNERVFTGAPSGQSHWGVDGGATGLHVSGDNTVATHTKFTYIYNTGAWTFTTTSGANLSGTGTAGLALNALRVANGNGADMNVDNFVVDISTIPAPTFTAQTPADGSYSGPRTNISVKVIDSNIVPINTNTIVLKVDGSTVAPSITKTTNTTLISYTPGSPLSAGSLHTALVTLSDNNNTTYTNTWSFTTGNDALPVTFAGPITTGGGNDVTIFSNPGEGWLGTNYNSSSSRTLYTRYSMVFSNLNGETGGGGGYGGLHYFLGNTEKLIVGNDWPSLNWSYDANTGGFADLNITNGTLPVNFGEWHTIVVRTDYVPNGNDNVTIYFDPDFTQTEGVQNPANVTQLSTDVSFDNIRLRCGNGTANAAWSNIVVAATSAGVGFQLAAAPTFQNLTPANGALSVSTNTAISAQVVLGGNPITAVSLTVDGGAVAATTNTAAGIMTVSYQPTPALSAGSTHNVQLVVTDNTNAKFTNSWSFATGYASLPVTVAGPFSTGGGNDLVLFSSAGEGWLGTNYNSSSSRTLYTRYSMVFSNLNGETGGGGGYGGLHFFLGNTEKLIVGNDWPSLNWSYDANTGGFADLNITNGTLPVNFGEWHTIVVRTDYVPNGNDNVTIYFDPDFTQTEAAQNSANVTHLTTDVSFDNVRLRCGNGTASASWSNIVVAATSAGVGFVAPASPTFQSYVPGQNATDVAPGTPISVTALFGSYPITSNGVSMTLDSSSITPSFVTNSSSITMNYQPPTAFAAGSSHTVAVNVTDSNGGTASNSWSFTVDAYPSLPVTLAGPVSVTGGGGGTTIWSAQNGWVGSTYLNSNFSGTLYTRFSMEFDNLNGETGNGGGFGGLHFYNGNNEKLLIGNNWGSINWSYDANVWGAGDIGGIIVFGEWHTFVVKTAYVAGGPDNVSVWMDPDLARTETGQLNQPVGILADVSFDSIHLRAGNGSAQATYSNIVVSATSPFAASVPQSVLSIHNGQLSWTSSGVLQQAPAVTGPWTDAASQTNPQSLITTGAAQFFRLRQ